MDHSSVPYPGERSVTIERDAVGNILLTGDGNQVTIVQLSAGATWQEKPSQPGRLAPNPYKGLAAFTEEDAGQFFGRERLIASLWDQWWSLHEPSLPGDPRRPRFLAVLGPSGSGKSSLVRAGLLPEFVRCPILGRGCPRIAVLSPGAHPLDNLASVLARIATGQPMPVAQSRELRSELLSPDGLRRISDALPGADRAPLILVVDQFEEVYALCESDAERDAFIAGLLVAAPDPGSRCSVIITLRADFLSATTRHQELNRVVSHQNMVVPVMTSEELRRAIAEPARRAGRPLDEALVELLVNDVVGKEGALPLLQFVLTRIWEGLDCGKAAVETLKELKGVAGALALEAERLFSGLGEADRRIARRSFLKMVQLGDGTKDTCRRALLKEIVAAGEEQERVLSVLRHFARPAERLITLGDQNGEPTADITHEALIAAWPALQIWLRESRDHLLFHRRLAEAADQWWKQGRPSGSLWRPPDLSLLRSFRRSAGGDLTAQEVAFASASERANRRAFWWKLSSATGVFVLAISVVYGFFRSTHEHERTLRSDTLRLIALSRLEGGRGNATNAILLALEALPKNMIHSDRPYSPEAEAALREALRAPREEVVFHLSNLLPEAIAFGPHGPLAANIFPGGVQIRNVADGTLVATLKNIGKSPPQSVVFSSDGSRVATVSPAAARVWNTEDEVLLTTVSGPFGHADQIAFSLDNSLIVIASSESVRVVDVVRGSSHAKFPPHMKEVSAVAFSPDSTRVAIGGSAGIRILAVTDGRVVAAIPLGSVRAVAFDAQGKRLAVASRDGNKVLNLEDKSIVSLSGSAAEIASVVAFNPLAPILAVASDDGSIDLYLANKGERLGSLRGHKGLISAIAFSPEGSSLETSSYDDTTRIWRIRRASAKVLAPYAANDSRLPHFTLSMGVGAFRYSFDPVKFLFDNREVELSFADWSGSIAFSPDGSRLATAAFDRTARIWKSSDESLMASLPGHELWGDAVAFSPDGSQLATASFDGKVRIWTANGVLLKILVGHTGYIHALTYSQDGSLLATGSDDGTARIWDALDGTLRSVLNGHTGWVRSVAFSADGKRVATASSDGTARVWDTRAGSPIAVFDGHAGAIFTMAFSPDGSRIAAAARDGSARLWDVKKGSLVAKIAEPDQPVHVLVFSPDGLRIAAVADGNSVRIWDSMKGAARGTFIENQVHPNIIYSIAFSPDGSRIAAAALDAVVIWSVEDGNLIDTLSVSSGIWPVITFSPDGSYLAIANPMGSVCFWKVFSSTQSLIDHACATLARDLSNEERRKFSLDFANRGKEYDGFLVPGQRPQRCRAKGES